MMEKQGQLTFTVHRRFREGEVRIIVDNFEVMRVLFDRAHFAQVLFEKLKLSSPFLTISEDQRRQISEGARKIFAEEGIEGGDEIIRGLEKELLKRVELQVIKENVESAAKRASDNLPDVAAIVWERLMQAVAFSGANDLREVLNMPSEKYSAKDIKDALFRDEWERIKPIAGVAHGGARARKAKFVWDEDKALQFYQTVEALPRYGADNRPMWEHAREVLRDNDYDHDTIQFLRSRPAFRDVPEELLKEAASVWRQYDERWDSLPPENSPLAFAFRHACHTLDFPYTAYNTVRTNYYKGKKGAEGTR
jgi:hypothetical protein